MSVRLFKSLLYKSAQIQQEIEREQKHRWPDYFRLIKLKKVRLKIKDRILRLIASYKSGVQQKVIPVKVYNKPVKI
jgi:uncharacterized protein YdcH (DUF465 family)